MIKLFILYHLNHYDYIIKILKNSHFIFKFDYFLLTNHYTLIILYKSFINNHYNFLF